MYLKRLELSGFKSFAKKTTLDFNSPVVAIVGPNGSGKSNVVESLRFVLGEQSMKSLRGKSGTDLIFKGGKSIAKMNRASATIVFDNSKKVFALSSDNNKTLKLDFPEVSISREVYGDGINKYLINGSEVRLKDIHELVASVNIGASGHHIISQGEADRILNASARDRRAMVEDALGLKIYQYRLKESVRKMDRTKINIKEAQSLRREIAPHINFLKKQVEKIEKSEELRRELETISKTYLKNEEGIILDTKDLLGGDAKKIKDELHEIESKLQHTKASESVKNRDDIELESRESELRALLNLRDELGRKLGRLEGMIELEESRSNNVGENNIAINKAEFETLAKSIESDIESALNSNDLSSIKPILDRIKSRLQTFLPKEVKSVNDNEIVRLRDEATKLQADLKELNNKQESITAEIAKIKETINQSRSEEKARDQDRFELMMKKNRLEGERERLLLKEESLQTREQLFTENIKELSVLVGPGILAYKDEQINDEVSQEELHRKIERIKIKLEDAGGIGAADIMKEYQEVSERDTFLSREIDDLEKSMTDIETMIRELKEKLDTEFREGIQKINKQFQEFFALMFGGGTGFLSVIVEQKKKKKDTDLEETGDEAEIEDEENPEEFHSGIDINVSLPQKKVKELSMLSGGERSLTSIALLFAISQVNPPPFLVLDETDAALDESNSRKYGDMIEKLAKYSQLIVVTHNRETMSRANILYGVTLGAEGGSKLLSVKFDEAVAIAK